MNSKLSRRLYFGLILSVLAPASFAQFWDTGYQAPVFMGGNSMGAPQFQMNFPGQQAAAALPIGRNLLTFANGFRSGGVGGASFPGFSQALLQQQNHDPRVESAQISVKNPIATLAAQMSGSISPAAGATAPNTFRGSTYSGSADLQQLAERRAGLLDKDAEHRARHSVCPPMTAPKNAAALVN